MADLRSAPKHQIRAFSGNMVNGDSFARRPVAGGSNFHVFEGEVEICEGPGRTIREMNLSEGHTFEAFGRAVIDLISGWVSGTPADPLHHSTFKLAARTADSEAMSAVLRKIEQFSGDGYLSSYGTPPNRWAVEHSKEIVRGLGEKLLPTRVVPMADGGIALVFSDLTKSKSVRISITNDEEVALTLDRGEGPEYYDVSPSEVVSQVSGFLGR